MRCSKKCTDTHIYHRSLGFIHKPMSAYFQFEQGSHWANFIQFIHVEHGDFTWKFTRHLGQQTDEHGDWPTENIKKSHAILIVLSKKHIQQSWCEAVKFHISRMFFPLSYSIRNCTLSASLVSKNCHLQPEDHKHPMIPPAPTINQFLWDRFHEKDTGTLHMYWEKHGSCRFPLKPIHLKLVILYHFISPSYPHKTAK